MTLAHPWAFVLASLGLPIVAAYLYKLHREKRAVASVMILRVILDERPAAQRSRARIRHRVSLALVLLAMLAAIAAIAGPRGAAGKAGRTILVLDRSASMGTREGTQTRLARAASIVADLANRAPDGDELVLIATGDHAGVYVAPTTHRADIIAAAAQLATEGAAGDNRDDALAFELADGLCREPASTQIYVISDGDGLAVPPSRCAVQTVPVGTDVDNIGISALSIRALDGLGLYDVHVGVASSFGSEQRVEVTLAADGQIVDVVALEVPARGDAERTVRVTIDRGRALTASLSKPDANSLDDRAEAPLTAAGPVSVLLVTSHPQSLVAEALRLHPRVELAIAAPGKLPTGRTDLIVLENDPQGALPPAPHVVALGANAAPDAPILLGDATTDKSIVRWDFDAPWFRFVDLHDLVLGTAHVVTGGKAIVDSGSGPIVAAAPWGARELLATGFSLDETDLTLRAAFPNLVANLVDWAAPATSTGAPTGVLSSAESHVAPREARAGAAPARDHSRLTDAPWLARIAALLALALLALEQILARFGARAQKPGRQP